MSNKENIKTSSRTIELKFPEFSDNSKATNGFVITRNEVQEKKPANPAPSRLTLDLNDGFIIEVKKKPVTSTLKAPPLVLQFNDLAADVGAKKPQVDQKPEAKPAVQVKAKPLELNMNEMSGSLNTMKFTSVKKPQAEPPKKQVLETPVPAQVTEPPPFTAEDWEIMKQHMDLPQPQAAAVPCYDQLLEVNKNPLVVNTEEFVCPNCESFMAVRRGVVLKGCLHNFCRYCLINQITNNHDDFGQVKCPLKIGKCEVTIDDEEVKELLAANYDQFVLKVYENLNMQLAQQEASKYDTLPALLLNADNLDFIENFEEFECTICYVDIEVKEGIILKNCLHKFCKMCLTGQIEHSEDFEVKCPEENCEFSLTEREIRGIVTEELFEKHLAKSLKQYEATNQNNFHCKTPDCHGFIEVDANVRGFTCEVCSMVNCIGCKAIHQGKNCQEYQDEINPDGKRKREDEASETAIKNMMIAGDAMYCPRCGIPVMKQDGCDYITCGTCKLGICWVTKKPRQPLTKTDGTVIDGCHCRENGQKCHVNCGHCH